MKGRFRRGFTIPEILVVAGVLVVVGAVVASLFTRGNSLYRHSETHIEMQRSGRVAIARITPYVSSMFDGDIPIGNPIVTPPPDPLATSESVVFFTTEDWLAPGYPSPSTSSLKVMEHGALESLKFLYRIRLDSRADGGTGHVLLERLAYDETTFVAGDSSTYPMTEEMVLYRARTDEEILNFRFHRVRASILTLEFQTKKTTRSDSNQPIVVLEDFRSTFNLPHAGI